jgi:predicted component of type VI protein secretion system
MIIVPLKERMVIGCRGEEEGETPDLDFSAFNAAAQGMSQCHAAFLFRDDMLFITDLNSGNGTRINGLVIPPERRYRLRNGDELEFGHFRICVRVGHVTTAGQFR